MITIQIKVLTASNEWCFLERMSVAEVTLRPYGESAELTWSGEDETDYMLGLENLDRLSCSVPTGDITDIVGVLDRIKPAAMVSYRPELPGALEGLNLSVSLFGYDTGSIDRMTVSKDPHLANELAELFQNGYEADDRCRRIGMLLGYPKSAIDYYLRRRFTIESQGELPMIIPEAIRGTIYKEFCQFNLSLEHWREEIEQYAIPLEKAVRNLTPETYSKICERFQMRKTAGSALGIMGVRIMLVSEDSALQAATRAA
jgi:hypothetical protein